MSERGKWGQIRCGRRLYKCLPKNRNREREGWGIGEKDSVFSSTNGPFLKVFLSG